MEPIQKELKCYCCEAIINEIDNICTSCGYPLKGTSEEQKQHSINYTLNRVEKSDTKKNISEVRLVLFGLSIISIIFGIFQYYSTQDIATLVLNIIIASMYAGLGVWSKYKPFIAILTGLILYLLILILNAIFEPSTIGQGIFLKVIIISAFSKAVWGAYKLDKDNTKIY